MFPVIHPEQILQQFFRPLNKPGMQRLLADRHNTPGLPEFHVIERLITSGQQVILQGFDASRRKQFPGCCGIVLEQWTGYGK